MSKGEKRRDSERENLRIQMQENAAEIRRLHRRVKETSSRRTDGVESQEEFLRADREFHDRYAQLCMPGGLDSGFMERLNAGEFRTVEAALCFLEVRPYFFHSGYMWNDLLRKCKRVPMNEEQASRFIALLERISEWKADREARAKRGMKVRNDLSTLFVRFERLFPAIFWEPQLDGIDTAGKLYRALCRKLDLEPLKDPSAHDGNARKPFSPGSLVRFPSLELHKSERHRKSSWNAADVWATLVATIREVYVLGEEFSIGPETALPINSSKR